MAEMFKGDPYYMGDLYYPMDSPEISSYGPKWEGSSIPNPKGTPTFSWANDDTPVDQLLRGWAIMTMLRDREITYGELAKHLGVSKQRVAAMINDLPKGDSFERIESAITEITDSMGGVYKATQPYASDFDVAEDERKLAEWLAK